MKRTEILCLLLIAGRSLLWATTWPELTPDRWRNMTPQELNACLAAGNAVDERDGVGMTALMRAVQHTTDPVIVTILLDQGAAVDVRDEGRWTPLMRAARSNPEPAIHRALIAGGADVNARNMADYTALIWAARENPNPEVITVLLDAGANPALRGVDGRRAADFLSDNPALRNSQPARRLRGDGINRSGSNYGYHQS